MQAGKSSSRNFSLYALVALAGGLYSATHLINSWLFSGLEITDHISFIYLPSFLRLVNVLVLGLLWGTLGTALGGLLLFVWMSDSLLLSICNTAISAGSAALALLLMQFMQKRKLSITRLSDLLQLAVLYALLNALIHHLLWSAWDPSQLIHPNQLFYMVIGDINGAIIGALVLRWLANHTPLIQFVREQASRDKHNSD